MDAAEALFFAHPFWVWIALGGVFLIGELIDRLGLAAVAGRRGRRRPRSPPLVWPLRLAASRSCSSWSSRSSPPTSAGASCRRADRARATSTIRRRRLVGQEGEAVGAVQGWPRPRLRRRQGMGGRARRRRRAGRPKAKVEVIEILGGAA